MEFEAYTFILLQKDITEDDIVFHEFTSSRGRKYHLAHYQFPNGLRVEILRTSPGYYSIMEIDREGNRDYYFLQDTLKDTASLINHIKNRHH